MTIQVQTGSKYNLETFAGDSGFITISNIPTDSPSYVIYMEIKGQTSLEKTITLNGQDTCTFSFTPNETIALGVGSWEYGIKLCNTDTGIENTLVPDLRVCSKAIFVVYPEKVEGADNG